MTSEFDYWITGRKQIYVETYENLSSLKEKKGNASELVKLQRELLNLEIIDDEEIKKKKNMRLRKF